MVNAPFYLYNTRQAPGLFFLKSYKARNFSFDFPLVSPRVCEIIFIQEGRLLETSKSGTVCCEQGSVLTHARDRVCRQWSDSPVYHAFEIGLRFSSGCVPMTEEDVRRWIPADNEVILPARVDAGRTAAELEKHIKAAIHHYQSPGRERYLAVRAELMHIFRIMTAYSIAAARRQRGEYSMGSDYCRLACDYVAENISRPIREQDLARQLGISPAHLSRQFSRYMGMPLMEYIHRTKLQQVVHLIMDGGADLRQAADAVGIASTKYLSRLFRQYMGMSVTEYKKIHASPEL